MNPITTDQHHIEKVSRLLGQARRNSGLSLRELARRAGTSHATLLAYEQGKKVPAITTWLRIMEAAGLAVDFHTSRRIRERDGIDRGEELAAALRLAEQFPSKLPRHLDAPRFPAKAVR